MITVQFIFLFLVTKNEKVDTGFKWSGLCSITV